MLDVSLIEPETTRPLRRAEYDELVRIGAFDGERVELLYGTLVAMSPQDPRHMGPIERLTMLLAPVLAGRASVRVQGPFAAADDSEPEPDVAIVPVGDHRAAHPNRAHLVIEVAVSSLKKDRQVKAPLYALSGVAEYWVVDVAASVIHVYRQPTEDGYRSCDTLGSGQSLAIEAFSDVVIAVDDVFA